MATRRQTEPEGERPRRPPATTPEAREHQLISMAMDLAERQILSGTASSQVITHFLKLGSTRDELEKERLRRENLLLEAKVEQLSSGNRLEQLTEAALAAMKSYKGVDDEDV